MPWGSLTSEPFSVLTPPSRDRELILKWWILSQGGISALSYRLAKWDLYPLLTHLLEETLCHQTLNMIQGSWVLWTCFKHSPANGFAPGSPASFSEHLFPFSCLVSSPAGAAFCLPSGLPTFFSAFFGYPNITSAGFWSSHTSWNKVLSYAGLSLARPCKTRFWPSLLLQSLMAL